MVNTQDTGIPRAAPTCVAELSVRSHGLSKDGTLGMAQGVHEISSPADRFALSDRSVADVGDRLPGYFASPGGATGLFRGRDALHAENDALRRGQTLVTSGTISHVVEPGRTVDIDDCDRLAGSSDADQPSNRHWSLRITADRLCLS